LLGIEPHAGGVLHIAPQLPEGWWTEGWQAITHVGDGTITLRGRDGLLSGTWRDTVSRQLLFAAPAGKRWREAKSDSDFKPDASGNEVAARINAGTSASFELTFS
jgi:hypothetical protein